MRRTAVLGMALVLAGCAHTAAEPMTAADLAKKAGCTGYAKSDPEMYVQEQGDCTINGQAVTVRVFSDDSARDNWAKVAKAMGASGFWSEGSGWVLTSDDRAALEQGTKAAGGKVMP